MNCGFAVGTGTNFCANCGAQVTPGQAVCTNCGVALTAAPVVTPGTEQKNKIVAAVLAWFLGAYGGHNFYLGYQKKAIIQLVLGLVGLILYVPLIVSGVWALVEFIQILTGKIDKDAKGVPLK